jgi:hypothetical protein
MKQKTAMQLAIEDIEDLFEDEQSGAMILARMQVIKRLEFRLTTEKEQIEEAFMAGVENFSLDDVNLYYQQKYGDEKPVVAIQPNNEPRSNTNTFNDSKS